MTGSSSGSAASEAARCFEFTLNGETVKVENAAATTTLLEFLRQQGHTGSKRGCDEGDCGACTVALLERDAAGKPTYRAINSCIALLPMFAGREVVTVEGLAVRKGSTDSTSSRQAASPLAGLHPVQGEMVKHYGSQCGYCTPGFVVSMFEAYYRKDCREPRQISDQLCGNLCRCTGYRPIRDAAVAALAQRATAGAADRFQLRLQAPVAAPAALDYAGAAERFFRPTSLPELFALMQAQPTARLVAGATEIGVELNKKFKAFPLLISTEGVSELTRVEATPTAWRIGAAATLTVVEEAVAAEFPSLAKMLRVFASRQIRNRATLGGNLATASPIGDSAPVLLTLDAELVLASAAGERTVPLAEFFTAYRQTVLRPGEIIREVLLPRGGPAAGQVRRVDFLKVSKRRELDISIVAAALLVDCDAGGVVRRARIAFGGVAATPLRARQAETALEGRKLADAADAVALALGAEFKPIDDVRSGAEYRRGLVAGLWRKFVSGEQSDAQDGELGFTHGQGWPTGDDSRELTHESGVGHVTGGAQYADDLAHQRPMLDVWPVMAPHARARIKRRDATKARQAPGVAAVLLAEDIPGQNNTGPVRHDEPLLATDDVLFHGQLIALVVGDSLRACRAAAALVEVEYEPLPPVVGLKDAIAQEATIPSPTR